MKKKKGFVFLETIVVMTVLTTSLVLIYSSFNNVIISEKRRRHYNNCEYIYKSSAVLDYLKDLSSFSNAYKDIHYPTDNVTDNNNYILIDYPVVAGTSITKYIWNDSTENYDGEVMPDDNFGYLEAIARKYHIAQILIVNNITLSKNTPDFLNNSLISANVVDFIKTISNESGDCYMIVLYKETKIEAGETIYDDTKYQLTSFSTNGVMRK